MAPFTGLTLLLAANLCVSSALDHGRLEVLYPPTQWTRPPGSSIKLSCEANYDFSLCRVLHVAWRNFQDGLELTEPTKFLTTVNETLSSGDARRRQVVTEILSLTPDDGGQYQCKAECDSGESAMGHFVQISVTA